MSALIEWLRAWAAPCERHDAMADGLREVFLARRTIEREVESVLRRARRA